MPSRIHPDADPIPGYSFADCDLLSGDHLDRPLSWRGSTDLSAAGDQVAVRLRMFQAKLFAYSAGPPDRASALRGRLTAAACGGQAGASRTFHEVQALSGRLAVPAHDTSGRPEDLHHVGRSRAAEPEVDGERALRVTARSAFHLPHQHSVARVHLDHRADRTAVAVRADQIEL